MAMFGGALDPMLEEPLDKPGAPRLGVLIPETFGDTPGVAVVAPGVLVMTPGCVPNVPPITPGEEGAGPSTPGEGCGPTAGAPGEPGVVVCANAPALAASAAAAISVLLSIMAILRGYAEAISASTQSACREFGL